MSAVKPRPRGSVHDAITRAFDEIQQRTGEQGIAAAAATLGVSQWLLYAASDPDRDGELSLLRAGLLTQVYGIRELAEWLADKAGCDLVERTPASGPGFSGVLAALGQTVQDLSDQHLSDDDVRNIQALIRKLHGLMATDRASAGARLQEVRT
ncbi:MAG: hypothetical protein CMN87_14765 [Stappia sp.]|mgnify:CR=1 FL=1|uniref:hypothetical protein n=1 Tax=Stappia sp. TaxID=1870903 RepID=UPI000C57B330|nr:hypothetical protein [Stappia sp.]MAA99717.1 hypothetical protein [Stappia sp.]MBM21269.1 hypothetical protein [Stappia sp.]